MAILITLIIVTILIIIVTYNRFVFRMIAAEPDITKIPTSSKSLSFTFSQPVRSIGKTTINNKIIYPVIKENTVQLPLISLGLKDGDTVRIVIENILSTEFNNKIDSFTKVGTVKYVDFSGLSEQEQKKAIDSSNSGQSDDPFMQSVFPILDEQYRYQIDATTSVIDSSMSVIITFLSEIPDYDNGGKITQLPDETAEEYRKSALDTIRKRGGNPDKYTITYSNNYLNNKYKK